MSLGATTYASVTWTTGDIITETKLDNMVGNDQAYDSHAAQGILLNNNTGFYQKDSGGTNREILNINGNNYLQFGYSGLAGLIQETGDDGWLYANETWTYASASTFTISGDKTTRYKKGDKIRWKQGGSYKYGYVLSSSYSAPNTTVTIAVNNDYSIANSSITDNYFSRQENPVGFPQFFNWVVSWSNFTPGNGTLNVARYRIEGNKCEGYVKFTLGSTSAVASQAGFTAPIAISLDEPTGGMATIGNARFDDTGTGNSIGSMDIQASNVLRFLVYGASGTYVNLVGLSSTAPHTWANTDIISGRFSFEI